MLNYLSLYFFCITLLPVLLHFVLHPACFWSMISYYSLPFKHFAGYNPPTPPSRSGPHRYYLFAFEQKHSLDDRAEVGKRCQFSVDDYKEKNDLTPVAMNMFQTVNNS